MTPAGTAAKNAAWCSRPLSLGFAGRASSRCSITAPGYALARAPGQILRFAALQVVLIATENLLTSGNPLVSTSGFKIPDPAGR